jgi:hypothetical protein
MIDFIATLTLTVMSPALGNNTPVNGHDTTDGKLAGNKGVPGLIQGNPHELFVFAHHNKVLTAKKRRMLPET